jgi:hypothetical protein
MTAVLGFMQIIAGYNASEPMNDFFEITRPKEY